jgi:hypothetical protein
VNNYVNKKYCKKKQILLFVLYVCISKVTTK